jgi:hypothetical protein
MVLRVLGYLEDGEWAAHCLETDLVGRAKTFREAMKELVELTEMQVSFALQTHQPSLLDHPAPPHVWQTYERLAQEHLRNFNQPHRPERNAIGAVPLPESPGRLAWCGSSG